MALSIRLFMLLVYEESEMNFGTGPWEKLLTPKIKSLRQIHQVHPQRTPLQVR